MPSPTPSKSIDSCQLSREERHKYRWQRFLVRFLTWLSGWLQRKSHKSAMRFATGLGNFAYSLPFAASRNKGFARRNLRLVGYPEPDSSPAEREALIRAVFVSFAKSLVDFLRAPALTDGDLDRLVRADGFEHIEAAMAKGKGVVLITAHMGNWELLGRWLAHHGVPLTVVGRDPESPEFAAWVRKMREGSGMGVASKGGSVRELLGMLKRNEAVGLLPDQNSGDIFVPFFGVPAGTVAGPATLALHTGATLLPVYCVRLPGDTYRLLILPPIPTESTGDKTADIRRIMAETNQVLESLIRQYPDQWLWIHNRWKSAFGDGTWMRCWIAEGNGGEAAYRNALQRWEQ